MIMAEKFKTKEEAISASVKHYNHGQVKIIKVNGTPCFNEQDYWIVKFGNNKFLMDNGEIIEYEYYGNSPVH